MSEQPTLYGLLNNFELINGAEAHGPEASMILLSLWRKSNKLNWTTRFEMTNTELMMQTGIRNRHTLDKHRKKLVEAGLIKYTPPPKGMSRGKYVINFNLLEPFVAEVGRDVGQELSNLQKVGCEVGSELGQNLSNITTTVLNKNKLNNTSTTEIEPGQNLSNTKNLQENDEEGMPSPQQDATPVLPVTDAVSGQGKISKSEYKQAIRDKYLTRRGYGFDTKASDEEAISEFVTARIPLSTVLEGIDKAFDEYQPDHAHGKIRTLRYCLPKIFDLHNVKSLRESDSSGEMIENANPLDKKPTRKTTNRDILPPWVTKQMNQDLKEPVQVIDSQIQKETDLMMVKLEEMDASLFHQKWGEWPS